MTILEKLDIIMIQIVSIIEARIEVYDPLSHLSFRTKRSEDAEGRPSGF